MPFTLETARLRLRPLVDDDLAFVGAMLTDEESMRHFPKELRPTPEEWLQRQYDRYERDGHGFFVVTDKHTGEPLGQVGLVQLTVDGVEETELGWYIHSPFQQRGYATEAAIACRDHAFDVLGLEKVGSLVRPVNIPSQRVALKLGMKPVRLTMHAGLEHLYFVLRRRGRAGR